MKFFMEEKRDSEAREFKLLMVQVKVIDEDYSGALKVYEEIVKEGPRDFRPYLCQGVVYNLLRKNDEAEKQFEEYQKLVPLVFAIYWKTMIYSCVSSNGIV